MREIIGSAHTAARYASDELRGYLIALIFGIIAVLGAITFALLFKPWIYIWAYIGLSMRMAAIAMQNRTASLPQLRKPAIASTPTAVGHERPARMRRPRLRRAR
jgi:hypothetical protein